MSFISNVLQRSAEAPRQEVEEAARATCKTLRTVGEEADARPHILYIIDSLCVMGGTERVLLNMIRRLPKTTFRCSLVTFKFDETSFPAENIACPLYVLGLKRTYGWNALAAAVKIRNLIRKQRVSIVHTFFETSDLWAGPIARLSGCPILVSSRRDLGILRAIKHTIGYKLLRNLYDLVLTVSPQVRNYCIKHDRVPPEKIVTLFNGVDLDRVDRVRSAAGVRRELGIPEGVQVITSVANIRRVKGIDVLVEAAAFVCHRHRNVLFLVAGKALEPEYFRRLQTRIRDLGLRKNFRFLGPCADIFTILGLSDIFCLASRSEGFSNALLEAMAAGLPCVVTDVGGNREAMKHGEAGFIVGSGDYRDLAHQLIWLLDHPARARTMGRRAEAIVRARFSAETMMANLVGVYRDLLAARRDVTCVEHN